jgi:hypothetical protein
LGETEVPGRAEELSGMGAGPVIEIEMNRPTKISSLLKKPTKRKSTNRKQCHR